MSESVAEFVTVIGTEGNTTRLGGVATKVGALFTSLTVTTNEFVTLTVPSLTTVVMVYVPGPCASDGVHVMTPLEEITAFVGGATKEYVKVFGGMSESVALFVTVMSVSSLIVRLPGVCTNTGGLFTSVTVSVKEFVVLRGGYPLSVTT